MARLFAWFWNALHGLSCKQINCLCFSNLSRCEEDSMARLIGILVPAGGGGERRTVDWSAFRVTLYYTSVFFGESKLVERHASVFSTGRYELTVNGNERKDKSARIAVTAPSGEVLASHSLQDLFEGEEQLKPIEVRRPRPDFQLTPVAVAAAETARLSGRVFARRGGAAAAAGQQVRLLGRAGEEQRWVPIWSGKTDRSGYFAATVRRSALTAAAAVIGPNAKAVSQPITLAEDGWLPDPLILFIDGESSSAAGEDCACDVMPPPTPDADELAVHGESFSVDLGVSCQTFTTPNRTLEEFDFYRIARTTDPEIKGLTLPDSVRRELNLPEIDKLVFDRGSLAHATQMSNFLAISTPSAPRAETRDASTAALAGPDAVASRMMSDFSRALSAFRPARNQSAREQALVDYVNLAPLSASGVKTAATWRLATDDQVAAKALAEATARIPTAALRAALEDPDGFTPERVMTLERRASAEALADYLNWRVKPITGRGPLNESNPMDWDYTPRFYQAVSIAHGHLLQYKQEWKADGYSLGEVVKSIPLAPGQKKQIAILDWDRTDTATRTEETTFSESLTAELSRDRDINEIANSSFRESLNGGSSAKTGAVGGGFGLALGPLVIGGGGGSSWASSEAWSNNSRDFSAQTMNDLRDRTSQAASAVRNQRSTVVETVYQRERVGATTEVIANHNRCHALTIQYFEVLRHFAVQERLAGVQECLFVPLEMTLFDDAKVLRWYDILRDSCRRPDLLPGFDSIRRLNSPDLIPPDRRFADDSVEETSGRLRLRVSIARPKDPDEASRAVLEQTEWRFLGIILRVSPETIYERYRRNSAKRDEIFRKEIAPETARAFLESLQAVLVDSGGNEHDAGLDLTVLSRYEENGVMEVELNEAGRGPRLTRAQIAGISIRSAHSLPEFSKVILESATFDYRTERMDHRLYNNSRVNDDLQDGDSAFLSTAELSWREERNQLTEDRARRRRLIRHLNDNIELYHRAIWLGMDPARRYMLLDGFEAPRSGGRSVASVVDNRLLAVIGNCLVMPVAPGFQLDPLLAEAIEQLEQEAEGEEEIDPLEVLKRLYDVTPSPPRRHSVPTRGVFAEAVTGSCKSCEAIEEDRFWRWKDYPLPDAPPPIAPLSTGTRFAASGALTPTGFPDALVKFQTLPDAPNPTGMAAALDILGKDVFKDLTGLTQNQKNAMAAFTTAMSSSEAFAGEAFKLALAQDAARNIDRTLGQIQSAKAAGYLNDAEASAAARDALNRAIGADSSAADKDLTIIPELEEALNKAADTGSATVKRSNGETSESVSFKTEESELTIGAAKSNVMEYPIDIWLDVPLIKDQITSANDYEDSARTDDVELARFMALQLQGISDVSPDNPFFIDIIESALDPGAGFLRLTPDKKRFQIKVPAQIGYPADSKDIKKVAKPKSGKYPFVVLVHGNSNAWTLKNPIVPTGRVNAGIPLVKVKADDRKDYQGYGYLQKALAELKEPIVSISFSHAFPNMSGSYVELRSEMLLEAVRQVITEAGKPGALLADVVDFQNTGLFGHSRGGEAVVRAYHAQKTKLVPSLKFRAVCSLAPTDYRGSTNSHKLSMPNEPDSNFLVVYGTFDGDVSGQRLPGVIDRGGNGFRLYDRSAARKTMVTIIDAMHNRFNTKWPDESEWDPVPAPIKGRPEHQALGVEYVGGFFDLILNKNAVQQALFRNEKANKAKLDVGLQWRFGSLEKVVDSFTGAAAETGTRTPGAGGATVKFASLTPPAGSVDKSLELRVPHDDHAYRIDKAAVAGATHTLAYDMAGFDASGFNALTFRLGQLYPLTDQPAINLAAPPVFKILLEDDGGIAGTIDSATVYANQKNKWARPSKKEIDGTESTLMFLQTLQLTKKQLEDSAKPKKLDLTKLKSLKFEFDTGATAQDEIWLDTILFVRN
jgi:hypothetical protein